MIPNYYLDPLWVKCLTPPKHVDTDRPRLNDCERSRKKTFFSPMGLLVLIHIATTTRA